MNAAHRNNKRTKRVFYSRTLAHIGCKRRHIFFIAKRPIFEDSRGRDEQIGIGPCFASVSIIRFHSQTEVSIHIGLASILPNECPHFLDRYCARNQNKNDPVHTASRTTSQNCYDAMVLHEDTKRLHIVLRHISLRTNPNRVLVHHTIQEENRPPRRNLIALQHDHAP